jgi:hypothetical protein
MRVVETNVFQYDELDDRAKERAREWYSRRVFEDSCDWEFVNGVSYLSGKTRAAASTISSKTDTAKKSRMIRSVESRAVNTGKTQTVRYQNKKGTAEIAHTATPTKPRPSTRTGATYEAPTVKVTRVPASSTTPRTTSIPPIAPIKIGE